MPFCNPIPRCTILIFALSSKSGSASRCLVMHLISSFAVATVTRDWVHNTNMVLKLGVNDAP